MLHKFNTTDFFENHADIFYFRIVDRVATYRLQTKSLYLDKDGNISMWKSSGSVNNYEPTIDRTKEGNRTSFINMAEDERHYAVYPMSKDAVKYDNSNATNANIKKFSS